jgi:hypothetical protein
MRTGRNRNKKRNAHPSARSSTTGERVSLPLGVSFGIKKGDFLFSTGVEPKTETSPAKFSLPLFRRREDRDFFFLGDDDKLVTGAVTGVSALEVFDCTYLLVAGRRERSGGRSATWSASPPRRSLSSSAMPRAETGDGVWAVRSNNEVTAAAAKDEGNELRRERGCLLASGVIRLIHSSGVIVAGVFSSAYSALLLFVWPPVGGCVVGFITIPAAR